MYRTTPPIRINWDAEHPYMKKIGVIGFFKMSYIFSFVAHKKIPLSAVLCYICIYVKIKH